MQNERSPLLSVFVLIAVAFAALVPERAIMRIGVPQSESQPKSVSQLNVDRATSFEITDLSGVKSTSETLPAKLSIPAQRPAESSSGEMLGQMESSVGSSPPAPQTPDSEITHTSAETNTSEFSPAHRMPSARISKKNAPKQRFRPPHQLGAAEVKKRLIALWHQSLLHSEESWARSAFSKPDTRNKPPFTAKTDTHDQ
jgi:hypothetical protein